MGRYQKSLSWAFGQFINRTCQDISYEFDAGLCKPSRIIFCLTVRCNLTCEMCGFPRTPRTKELTTDEWKKIILELKSWIGPYRIQLAGGEVFLRQDTTELVRFGYENDVLMGIVTNGTLIDNELAEKIAKSGLSYFDISLDGIRPATHDRIRGVDGVYQKVMTTIKYMKRHRKEIENDLSIMVATVIMGPNMGELVDLVDFAEKEDLNGISFNPLGPPHDIGNNPQWYKDSELWPKENELDKLDKIIDQLILLRQKGARILNSEDQFMAMKEYFRNPIRPMGSQCKVGVTNLLMTPKGDIHTCGLMPSIGSIEEPFHEIWRSDTAKEVRRMIKKCKRICSPGNFIYTRSIFKDIIRYLQFR